MLKTAFALFCLSLIAFSVKGQIVINEASNRNQRQIIDEDGDYNDWIELYNTGITNIDLQGWALSDSRKNPLKWEFNSGTMAPGSILLIHASGKDRRTTGNSSHWESAVLPTDTFTYLVPSASTPTDWFQPAFDDSHWDKGIAGFGFADDDDQTILPENTLSVYLRRKFNISDTSMILGAIFHADYDDGFVAYLNGTEIARAYMNGIPQWNSPATDNHEAVMYTGGTPEAFEIDSATLRSILLPGENTLCVEAHNVSSSSSDLSIIPFLSFQIKDATELFKPTPDWFIQNSSNQLHTNFKIDSKGEKIFLSHNGVFTDSLYVPYLMLNHSLGRTTDGASQYSYFTEATPGTSNDNSTPNANGYTQKPELSYKAGFYASSIEVSISSFESNTTIRYTTNGSEPTESSALYSAPIRITSTKCIKARCFAPNKLPGEVATATYFINEDYTLPVLSVTTNNENLYGSSGIFTNWDEAWNVPCYAEYFEKDKTLAFSLGAGMQVDGGAGGSRSQEQHSFRIEPGNGTLGDGDLKYNLMPRRPNRNNFPSFYVRNGSNQYMVLPYKDALEVTALGQNTYTYYSAYHPIVVYINGSYFGVYELREKINDDYLVDNYQMNIDSLDFLGVSYFKGSQLEALRGSTEPFLADFEHFLQLNTQANDYLDEVDKFLDIKSYTDYIIAENWVANNDWPYNNIKLFRCKSTGYRWQWAINDLEWGLNPNGWTTANFNHFDFMDSYGPNDYFSGFWYSMMKNATYKADFINRYADLMNTSYLFSSIGKLENEMFNEIYPEMDGEFSRWRSSSNIAGQLNTFTKYHETFRKELERRSAIVRTQIKSRYGIKSQITVTLDVEPKGAGSIQISTIVPTNYPWQGIYFTNIPITVTALPNPGYRFKSWDNCAFIQDLTEVIQTGTFTGTEITIKANFETNDTLNAGVVISEINYKPGINFSSPDWIELCNLSPDEVNLKGWYFTDDDSTHIFTFGKELSLAPNQRIVVSNNYAGFMQLYPGTTLYPDQFSFGLGSPKDEINLFNNQHEKVLSVSYSDIYPWPLSNDFTGRTLELRNPQQATNQPLAWFRGCIGGSPGEAFQPCDEDTVSAPEITTATRFDLKVYPNPAGAYVNLRIDLPQKNCTCTARLYDLTGNLMNTFTLKEVKAGTSVVRLPLEDVRGNIFFLKVTTDEGEKTVKIIKIK